MSIKKKKIYLFIIYIINTYYVVIKKYLLYNHCFINTIYIYIYNFLNEIFEDRNILINKSLKIYIYIYIYIFI